MSTQPDLGPVVRAWLHEVPALPDRDRVIGRVRAQVHATGQRRGRWATGWATVANRPMPALLLAAVTALALGSAAVLLVARQEPSQVAAPAPTPTLVVAAVAPGIEHVLGDGLRDFDRPEDTSMNKTAIGLDGTIWMLETDRLFRVGEAGTFSRVGVGRPDEPNWVPGFHDDIQVAYDGTLFTESWPVMSFDGTAWNGEWAGYLFPGQADGAIWAYGGDDLIGRWDDGHWTRSAVPGVHPGSPWAAVAVDDVVWMGRFDPEHAAEVGYLWTLARVDDDIVEDVLVPGVPADASPTLIAAGSDGTLWVYLWDREQAGHLAKLTPDGWAVYHEADGVPIVRDFYEGALGFMAGGPDGSVWLTPQTFRGQDCGGIARFDGSVWTSYLEDVCIVDLDIAPDGSAWVQTLTTGPRDAAAVAGPTYRVTPAP